MDTRRFRSLCANVDGLSVGQLRGLRRKLGELDAWREVLARIDARGQALKRCVHCGATALVRDAHGGRLRCKSCGRTFSAATDTALARVRLEKLGAKRGPRVIERAFHIQTVNNLHSRFETFMRPFCGPASKHLPAYLAWFIARLAAPQTAFDNAWRRLLAV